MILYKDNSLLRLPGEYLNLQHCNSIKEMIPQWMKLGEFTGQRVLEMLYVMHLITTVGPII